MAKQADLLSVDEARERILARFHRLATESVPLEFAHMRALGAPVSAPFDLPPFANSSMDGFAVMSDATAAASVDKPVTLPVAAHIPAGSSGAASISRDECARIMTGAPLPEGADAVVPFENVEDNGDVIVVTAPVPARACVRPAGQDARAQRSVISPGVLLTAPRIALLAALGLDSATVVKQPRIAIISTGDELVAPGSPLRPGQIYNSNGPMLGAAVLEAGGAVEVVDTAQDDPETLRSALQQASGADLLLTSGGASVGDFDHVKAVVGDSGKIGFWRVRMRPGKPLLFGDVGGTPILGLPGNPTSAMATFEQFVRPAIRTMLGLPPRRPEVRAILDESLDNRGGRRTYARVRLRYEDGAFHATASGPQDSAMLVPLAHADGLLEMPEDRDEVRAGESAIVQVWHLPDLV